MEIPEAYRPTTDLAEAYHRCDPLQPLSGQALEYWYVDCAEARGAAGFMERILQRIERAGGATGEDTGRVYEHVLITGHKGCGKSTELHCLEQQLQQRGFLVVYVDTIKYFTADNLDAEAVILATVGQLVAHFEALKIPLDKKHLEAIRDWFGRTLEEKTATKEAGMALTGEAGVGGKSPLVSLLVKFAGYMKQATSSRATSSVEYRQYLSELAERTNELLIRAQLTVQEKLGPDTRLAVILDGLDRVDLPDHQREIFMDYRDLFARMACHAVLTVPIPVACSSERRSLQEAFGQIEMLPCLKVDEDAGMEKAREMVYKRCDSSLFAPGVVDSLCRWSGGDVRNLMRLLRGANSGAAQPPISAADAEAAFWATARDFSSWLQEEHYAVLVSHDLNRSLVPTDDPGPELLQAGAILAYSNHNPWYLVHPAIKELARFKELREEATR